MRRGEGQIQEEGISGVFFGVAFEEVYGVRTNRSGGVEMVSELTGRQLLTVQLAGARREELVLIEQGVGVIEAGGG